MTSNQNRSPALILPPERELIDPSRRSFLGSTLAAGTVGALAGGWSPASSAAQASTRIVAKLTGPNSWNDKWALVGTDLGVMWDDMRGNVLFAFGDTANTINPNGGPGNFQAKNALVRSRATFEDMRNGIIFDSGVRDQWGNVRTIFEPQYPQWSCIPTSGFAAGFGSTSRQIMSYMQVYDWNDDGRWSWKTDHSGLAWSDDDGEHWLWMEGASWANNPDRADVFQVMALAPDDDGWVYLGGTQNGRRNDGLHMARVRIDRMHDRTQYEYWDGREYRVGAPAVSIVPGPVGEPNLHKFGALWLLTYINVFANFFTGAIQLRTATRPEGPWSAPLNLIGPAQLPGMYGGFMHPWSRGNTLYTTVSQWNPYCVYLCEHILPFNMNTGPGL
ncbi:DUF4185 domain-containing protein [Luteimonas panaciterrae]|uniref:DUF4185 domain-containing protein n=1 Tax=Luteimonas panaciterrae TaxID=363885 RepID=UPI001CFA7720|nr:DUF4185 domain-containing protein [Luteimonas panaciterrae]